MIFKGKEKHIHNLAIIWLCSLLNAFFSTTAAANTNGSQELFTMTWSTQPTSLEPNSNDFLVANHALASHIFDPLFNLDSSGRPRPILVKSFKIESPTQWLFTLKSGIKFHDGSELSSADVIATFDRINRKSANNPYQEMISDLQYEAINPSQFRITTEMPDPDLLSRLILFFIIKKSAQQATSEQFNSGEFMIGTGPYRLVSQRDLRFFSLKAFEDYHREPAYLKQVNIVIEQNNQQRIQDYTSGKTDFIDKIAPLQAQKAAIKRKANLINVADNLLYLLYLDVYNDQSPDIRDHNGRPMNHNPLKNRKVRLAMSLALNRTKLIEKIFGDSKAATATGQLTPPWSPAVNNRILTPVQDIEQAKQLLIQAGYPDGFQIVIHDKDTRLPWIKVVANMLSQANIQVTPKIIPSNLYMKKAYQHQFSVSAILEKMPSLRVAVNETISSKSKTNIGRYANPEIDQLILEANQEFNDTRRIRQYRYIAELAMADQPVIPLFFTNQLWLIRPDVVFTPAGERLMEAYYIRAINHE